MRWQCSAHYFPTLSLPTATPKTITKLELPLKKYKSQTQFSKTHFHYSRICRSDTTPIKISQWNQFNGLHSEFRGGNIQQKHIVKKPQTEILNLVNILEAGCFESIHFPIVPTNMELSSSFISDVD